MSKKDSTNRMRRLKIDLMNELLENRKKFSVPMGMKVEVLKVIELDEMNAHLAAIRRNLMTIADHAAKSSE